MRGVQKQNSAAITSAMLGAFRERQETREEFMKLLKLPSAASLRQASSVGLTCVGED